MNIRLLLPALIALSIGLTHAANTNTANTVTASAVTPTKTAATGQPQNTIVQLGSFRNPKLASQKTARAALLGIRTMIVEFREQGQTLYRVRTKPMTAQEAGKIAAQLEQNGISAIMLQVES